MKAEIIAVGTELLMGQIVNTNAQFIAQQLNELGISHYVQTVIGDNPERLISVTKQAEKRSDIIIYSGGIGPTRDDLTKETLADYLQVPLVLDEKGLQKIKTAFKNRVMVDSNKKMALYFKDGKIFPNDVGQALGSAITKQNKTYIVLPGPPHELQTMFKHYVKPLMINHSFTNKQIVSTYLQFFGIGELLLADKLDDLIKNQTNPTIATYASHYVVTVRLTASGDSKDSCEAIIENMVGKIKARVGDYLFAQGEGLTPAYVLKDYLMESKQTIGFAESLTGGLASEELVQVPEASTVFEGSLVTYSKNAKAQLLEIDPQILAEVGMVSVTCAQLMAERVREKLQTDIAISFTGVAGPDSLEGYEPGTVFVGYAYKDKPTEVIKYQINGNRETVRHRIVYTAFLKIIL